MLPGFSGGTGQLVLIDRIDISERAADLTEDLSWGEGMCPGIGVLQQWWEGLAGVGMRDGAAQGSPQPFDAIGLRVVRGRVDQHELTTELVQQRAQLERASGRMDAQIVQQHQSNPATRLRARD